MTTISPEVTHLADTVRADSQLAASLLERQLRAIGGPDESPAVSAVADAIAGSRHVATIYAAAAAACLTELADSLEVAEAQLAEAGIVPRAVQHRGVRVSIEDPDLWKKAHRPGRQAVA